MLPLESTDAFALHARRAQRNGSASRHDGSRLRGNSLALIRGNSLALILRLSSLLTFVGRKVVVIVVVIVVVVVDS